MLSIHKPLTLLLLLGVGVSLATPFDISDLTRSTTSQDDAPVCKGDQWYF